VGLDLQFHVDAAHGDATQGFFKAFAPVAAISFSPSASSSVSATVN
jgi:hypothetical protein